MAWPNITERRNKVKLLDSSGLSIKQIQLLCCEEFACSTTTILADIYFLKDSQLFISKKIRTYIKIRDKSTCQYCERRITKGVIEHVIPVSLGEETVVIRIPVSKLEAVKELIKD